MAVACSGCLSKPAQFDGPLTTRNQHPAQLVVGRLLPRAARATPAGAVEVSVDASYTSLFLGGADDRRLFRMDGESLRAATGARVGLGHGLDVRVELPVAQTSGGFLDAFVIDWHDWFGLPDQGRDDAPQGRYDVRAERDGRTLFEVEESSFEWLDVPVTAGWTVVEPSTPGGLGGSLTLRAGLELPAGDGDRGFGNDEIDWMLGVAGEWRSEWIAVQAQVQHTFAGTSDRARAAGFEFQDVTIAGLGIELPVHDRWSVLVQSDYETSTLRDFGLSRTDDPQWLLWTGARYLASDRFQVEFALGEDLLGFIAPDFSGWVALRYRFGPRN